MAAINELDRDWAVAEHKYIDVFIGPTRDADCRGRRLPGPKRVFARRPGYSRPDGLMWLAHRSSTSRRSPGRSDGQSLDHLQSSLPIRRDATQSPSAVIATRYSAWPIISQPPSPVVSPRNSATPW